MCAVYPDAQNAYWYPDLVTDGYQPWPVREVWVMGIGGATNHVVDITDQLDRKIAALRCHGSQFTDPDAVMERVRTWLAAAGSEAGLGEGRSAARSNRTVDASRMRMLSPFQPAVLPPSL